MQRFGFLSAEESDTYEELLKYDPFIREIRQAEEQARRIVKKEMGKEHA